MVYWSNQLAGEFMEVAFILKWLLAFSPIAAVLILMIGFHWGGGRAGAAGWFVALFVSVFFFGAHPTLLAYAQGRGVLLSLHVLFIVWMALLLFNVVNEAGAIETIGSGIQRLTRDRAIQLLILGWAFSAFLQGVAGFGVPIAVVAPLLVGLGFSPVIAVAVPAIGHSWAVTFGDMASSFQALIAVTGLPGEFMAHWSCVFLGITILLCGAGVAFLFGGLHSVRHCAAVIILIGGIMALIQYGLAQSGLWTLAGFVAAMVGMILFFLVVRLPLYQKQEAVPVNPSGSGVAEAEMSLFSALSPYIILIVIVSAAELWIPLHKFLNQIYLSLYFPEITSDFDWVVNAGFGKKISVFGHPGSLLTYVSLIGFIVFSKQRYYANGSIQTILSKTIKSGVPTSLGIVSMICFSMIMDHAGMTYLLAQGISSFFGKLYPIFASPIGTLGAFMTGSNTNSNVVFGALQKQTAELAKISVAVILGAQTTGGSIGSMLAPAKIIVGCSTVGLSGKEGPVLAATLKYGLVITAVIGVLTMLAVYI
jgi:lactate permease